MSKLYCAKCNREMTPEHTGVLLRWRYDNSDAAYVIAGDQYGCRVCGQTAYHVATNTKGTTEQVPRLGAFYVDMKH